MWMNKLRKTHSSAWEAVDPLLLLPITGSSGKSSWLPVFVSVIVICYCCLLFDLFSVGCLQASGWASGSLSGFELTLQSWSHRPLGPELSLSAHQTPLSQTGLKSNHYRTIKLHLTTELQNLKFLSKRTLRSAFNPDQKWRFFYVNI